MKASRIYAILFYLAIATTIVITDFMTKQFAYSHCTQRVALLPFLFCEVTINRGISYGLLQTDSPIFFSIITIIIALVTAFVLYHAYQRFLQHKSIIPELLIGAGSCANLLDRIFFGGVIDFILISYGRWHFPIFNGADICIVLGVFFLMYRVWRTNSL